MDQIPLEPLFPGFDWNEARIHVAQHNGKTHPIDVYAHSFEDWRDQWNGNYQSRHYWNKQYIFSMIEIPKQTNNWLFGGIFRVTSHKPVRRKKNGNVRLFTRYTVEDTEYGNTLIGRLIIGWKKTGRGMSRIPSNMLDKTSVLEIKSEPYAGEDFPGHGNINHNYSQLEKLWNDKKSDWRHGLAAYYGIYLISDTYTGKRYIGAAYGEEGIYARWGNYFANGGHGGNKLLKELISVKGIDYAREHFTFSVLEQIPQSMESRDVTARESYWKRVLLTRDPRYGLNDN